MIRYAYRCPSLFPQLTKIVRMRRPHVTGIQGKPQKVLHSSYTGQKWSIFSNYISDL